MTRTDSIHPFRSSGGTAAAADAVAAGRPAGATTILFASTSHDLTALGRELACRGVDRVIGAAAGRVIGADGFAADGVAGFHLPPHRFATADTLLEDPAGMALPELRSRVQRLRREFDGIRTGALQHCFAILLADAESRCEERLAGVLGMELNGMPLIGGSAGDLYFNPLGHPPGSTRLLYHGEAKRAAAILCLVASASPVAAYCHNHYLPSDKKMVITDAEPERRVVREIDGTSRARGLCSGLRVSQEAAEQPGLRPVSFDDTHRWALLSAWHAAHISRWRPGIRLCARAGAGRRARPSG